MKNRGEIWPLFPASIFQAFEGSLWGGNLGQLCMSYSPWRRGWPTERGETEGLRPSYQQTKRIRPIGGRYDRCSSISWPRPRVDDRWTFPSGFNGIFFLLRMCAFFRMVQFSENIYL